MFSAIARSYDLNNRLHSMWRDQAWRRAAVKMANVQPTDTVVDVACGTGDLAMAFHNAGAAKVIGIDFTVSMLQIAECKRHQIRNPKSEIRNLAYHAGDAMNLPLDDACADVVSIAFGIRNVAKPQRALDEFHRILRPGGRLIVLEFSQPTNPLFRRFDKLYREQIMPRTATLIARDRSGAYKYLPKSVSTFLSREQMIANITAAGFADVTHKVLTFGIAVCYRGIKP